MLLREVFKYPVPYSDRFTLLLPTAAEILHFGEQSGALFIWALVEPDSPKVSREFLLRGTGHEIEGNPIYLGTDRVGSGLVWHLFEETP